MYAVGGQILMATNPSVLPMQMVLVGIHKTGNIDPDYIGSTKPTDMYP